MSIREFFLFETKLSKISFSVRIYETRETKIYNKLLDGNYIDLNFPVLFKHEYGKRLEDVLDTSTAVLYLISDKMRNVLEHNNLTGWKTFPVTILDKDGREVVGYHGFSIIGRCGPVDYKKCEIIEKRFVPTGPLGKYYKGLYIGLDEWDGTDFFLPDKFRGIIITSKTASILKINKLTNINLKNLYTIETPDFVLKYN